MGPWRSVVRTNLHDLLASYAAANPDVLRATYQVRPGAFGALPAAYVGDMRLEMLAAGNIRMVTPTSSVECVFVSDVIDNNTNKRLLDDIVDAMVSQLLSTPHLFGSNTTFDRVTAADTLVQVGETVYTAIAVTISDLAIQEGD
jgi:hypothetical protein